MQRNINYHYKSFDFSNVLNMDEKRYGAFNEYGYNLDCVKKRVVDNEQNALKSKDNNVKPSKTNEKH